MSKITDFIDEVIMELECEKTIQDCLDRMNIGGPPEDLRSYKRIETILTTRAEDAVELHNEYQKKWGK